MVEFAEHYITNKNICLFIRDGQNNSINAYVPAIIAGINTRIILTEGSIDAAKILNNDYTRYYKYYLTKKDGQWTQYKDTIGKLTIATKEYVDEAVANIDIPEGGDVDLSDYYTKEEIDNKGYLTEHQSLTNYYTKDETTQAIQNAINAIGNAEGGAY